MPLLPTGGAPVTLWRWCKTPSWCLSCTLRRDRYHFSATKVDIRWTLRNHDGNALLKLLRDIIRVFELSTSWIRRRFRAHGHRSNSEPRRRKLMTVASASAMFVCSCPLSNRFANVTCKYRTANGNLPKCLTEGQSQFVNLNLFRQFVTLSLAWPSRLRKVPGDYGWRDLRAGRRADPNIGACGILPHT